MELPPVPETPTSLRHHQCDISVDRVISDIMAPKAATAADQATKLALDRAAESMSYHSFITMRRVEAQRSCAASGAMTGHCKCDRPSAHLRGTLHDF